MKSKTFSPEMIRAILDGRKTTFRMPLEPQPFDVQQNRKLDKNGIVLTLSNPWTVTEVKPKYLPSETIYVKGHCVKITSVTVKKLHRQKKPWVFVYEFEKSA